MLELRCMGCMNLYDSSLVECPHCSFTESKYKSIGYHLPLHTVLDDTYIIGKTLGYGGFGVTYVGYNALLEKKVAIKEYLPGEFATRSPGDTTVTVFTGDKAKAYHKGLERFEQEAKKLANLKGCEGIVQIYDSFQANNTVYIVMECLQGETLRDLLKREGKLKVEKATAIISEVLNALKMVHEAGIIHRDISPDNIFITKDGRVKLIDFGAAKNATTNFSKSLSVIVKQGYAPPEQYYSKGKQGSWTDVYATAATYYKMLTGAVPEDSLERKANDMLISPSKLGVKLSKKQENALLNALELDIENRTVKADELLKGLTDTRVKVTRKKHKRKKEDLGLISFKSKIGIVLGITLVIISFVFGYGIVRDNYVSDQEILTDNQVYVPNVLNLSYEEAEKLLETNGLIAKKGVQVSADGIPEGVVVYQDIAIGELVEKGSEITLNTSNGGIKITIKDYVGLHKDDVLSEMDMLRLYAEFEEVYSPFEEGCIVTQSVDVGEELRQGNIIEFKVSKGMPNYETGTTIIPDYIGKNIKDIDDITKDAFLYIKVVDRKYSSDIPAGQIISQSYTPGQLVSTGTVVELEVSDGIEMIEIPSYYLTKADDYKELLEQKGFQCTIEYTYDDENMGIIFPGYIIDLDVEPGGKYPYGSEVTIYAMDGLLFDASIVNNPERITEKYRVGEKISIEMELIAEQGNLSIPWSAKFILNYNDDFLQFSGIEGKVTSEIISDRIENYESSLVVSCQGDGDDYRERIVITFTAVKEGETNILVSDYAYPYDQGFDSGFIVETDGYYYVVSETAELISYIIEE